MACTTYILHSKALDKYYVGHTCSPIGERLQKHNAHHKGFTGRAPDWRLVWKEEFEMKTDASRREREIKQWKSRTRIVALVQTFTNTTDY